MYVCDGNVWLALALLQHAHHEAARRWLDGVEDIGSVLFCRATQQTLLRLLTNAAVFVPYGLPPLTNAKAWATYEEFAAGDRIALRADEPFGILAQWKVYALRDWASPKLWMDAYLAAFALGSGCRMVTVDRAFQQFQGLDVTVLA